MIYAASICPFYLAELIARMEMGIQRIGDQFITAKSPVHPAGGVSALIRGRVDGYSLDRLFRFLNALGQEIEINLHAASSPQRSGRRPGIVVR